jgi:hypothetical protein
MLWTTKEYLSLSVPKKKAVFVTSDWVRGSRIPAKVVSSVLLDIAAASHSQFCEYDWIWFSIIVVEVVDVNLVFVTLYKRLTRSFDDFSSYYFCNVFQASLAFYVMTIIDLASPWVLLIIRRSADISASSYWLGEFSMVRGVSVGGSRHSLAVVIIS